MIDIKAFIKEALDNITKVKNLIVTYKIVPDVVTIALPSNYSESDMQIYIDDKCLDDFPGSNDKSKEVLGNNIDDINDAYTMAVNAAPTIVPTAISITFPRVMNFLNSCKNFFIDNISFLLIITYFCKFEALNFIIMKKLLKKI